MRLAAEKEAKRQAWLKKEQQKLEEERKRREAAEIERRQRLERERREEAQRRERERLAELEEEKRERVRCEHAAKHEYRMLFLRFKRRCALRKAARARAKVRGRTHEEEQHDDQRREVEDRRHLCADLGNVLWARALRRLAPSWGGS